MREFGPVRKDLNDVNALPYIGIARTLLGVLKTRMGGLPQGSMTRLLPDGTVIQVRSVFGQDRISIIPAAASGGVLGSVGVLASPKPARSKAEDIAVPKIITPRAKKRWRRGPDGPIKNGHEAVWDTPNRRMLVYSGWSGQGIHIDGLSGTAGTSHTNNTYAGNYVSGVTNYGASGVPLINSLGLWNAAGFSFTGPFGSNTGLDADLYAALVSAGVADGSGTDWYHYSHSPGFVSYFAAELTGPAAAINLPLYQFVHFDSGTGDYSGVGIVTRGGARVWDTYGEHAVNDGYARFAFPNDNGLANNGSTGVNDWNYGGDWYTSNGTHLGSFRDDGAGAAALFYEADGVSAWRSHSNAFVGGFSSHVSSFNPAVPPTPYDSDSDPGWFDLALTSDLWEFTLHAGWAGLGHISKNAWDAIVASLGASPADSSKKFRRQHFIENINDWYAPGANVVDFTPRYGLTDITQTLFGGDWVEFVFGGTFTQDAYSQEGATGQLWIYQ